MAAASPSLIPRPPIFPKLVPKLPQPYPTPLPKAGASARVKGKFNARRNLVQEMDDLDEEETELEDLNLSIRNRGYSWLVPIGRTRTVLEEKNEEDDDDEGSQVSGGSGGGASPMDDGENDESGDLDASMEDLDADDDEDDMADLDEDEEFQEEPSDV